MPHPAYKLVAAFGNRVLHFCGQNLPVLRVVLVKFVRAVLEKAFVFFFGVADQLVIIRIGPDKRKMFIHQMLTHAQAREVHQHIVFVALADGIFNEDFFLVFHGGPAPMRPPSPRAKGKLCAKNHTNAADTVLPTQLSVFSHW